MQASKYRSQISICPISLLKKTIENLSLVLRIEREELTEKVSLVLYIENDNF